MPRPWPFLLIPLVALVAAACSSGGDGARPGDDADASQTATIFDSTVVHDIEVSFDEGDYDEMIATFADSGAKTWIEATVTIDGTTYEQVGIRLKGNSSLAGLGGRFGGGFGSASTEGPEHLPWLIRLDEFVEGQDHQGYEDIVVRSNGSETALNEAVALDLLAQAGLASQEAVATSFVVNGSDAVLRLAIEHPDDDAWQEANFEGDGALYKAESTGDWSYRGDDAADYEEVWDQEGGSDTTDLAPLIDFLQFLNESDDATFADELADRLDVEAFARYLAMMDLVANFDDIDGPGNNAYLWYDIDNEQFTVVPWDLNLAFGAFGAGGPGGPGGGGPPGGFGPPEGFELPEGFDPSQLPGGFGGSNVLVERFHAEPELEVLYEEQLTELRAELYGGDAADDVLASWVETLSQEANELVDEATINAEADAIAEQFTAT